MRVTGLNYLDAAIKRYSLHSVSHFSPIQRCCEITQDMIHQDVVSALRSKSLLPLPYCVSQSITAFRKDDLWPTDSIFVHQITLPNSEPLCWIVVDDEGRLLEQAFCKHHGHFPKYCHMLVAYIANLSRKSKRNVA